MNRLLVEQKYLDYVRRLLALFHSLSRDLIRSIDDLLPLLEKLRESIDRFADDDLERKSAFDRIRQFDRGISLVRPEMPWVPLADIRGIKEPLENPDPRLLNALHNSDFLLPLAHIPPEACESAKTNLCAQLKTIRESAAAFKPSDTLYTVSINGESKQVAFRQLVHENNLVRPGADLHTFVSDYVEGGQLEDLLDEAGVEHSDADELCAALARFCGVYCSLLGAFDIIAALQKPGEQDFAERFASNENLIRARTSSSDDKDYDAIFKHVRYQLETDGSQ